MSHIAINHPEWKIEFTAGKNQKTMDSAEVSKKGYNLYSWLQWTIMGHHQFSFCDNERTRQFASCLHPISTDTLVRYVQKLVEISWILGTSNVCKAERRLSTAQHVAYALGGGIVPICEQKKYWDAKTVSQLASNHVDL